MSGISPLLELRQRLQSAQMPAMFYREGKARSVTITPEEASAILFDMDMVDAAHAHFCARLESALAGESAALDEVAQAWDATGIGGCVRGFGVTLREVIESRAEYVAELEARVERLRAQLVVSDKEADAYRKAIAIMEGREP